MSVVAAEELGALAVVDDRIGDPDATVSDAPDHSPAKPQNDETAPAANREGSIVLPALGQRGQRGGHDDEGGQSRKHDEPSHAGLSMFAAGECRMC